jgi:hypothetical protein
VLSIERIWADSANENSGLFGQAAQICIFQLTDLNGYKRSVANDCGSCATFPSSHVI